MLIAAGSSQDVVAVPGLFEDAAGVDRDIILALVAPSFFDVVGRRYCDDGHGGGSRAVKKMPVSSPRRGRVKHSTLVVYLG